MNSITNRTEWTTFVNNLEGHQADDVSIQYRTQMAALGMLNQPRPDCVTIEEFKNLKDRVQANLDVTKQALIQKFLDTMNELNVDGFNCNAINRGELDLSGQLSDLEDAQLQRALKAVSELVFLTKLDLVDNNISQFPPEILKLSSLTYLSLEDNNIEEIPPQISTLSSLKGLDLSSNQIKAIPPEVLELSQLEELTLGHNRIKEIPAGIERLSSLVLLHLQDNQIEFVPTEIGQLRFLNELFLENNPNLRELPMSLRNIPDLEHLDTERTQIPPAMTDAILQACNELYESLHQNANQDMTRNNALEFWAEFAGLSDADYETLENLDLTDDQKRNVNSWLNRLEESLDFRYAQASLAQKTFEMLLGLRDPEWKELFFDQVISNLEGCGDRASMAFNEIYTAWIFHSLPEDTPFEERLNLLIRVAKTQTLRKELTKLIGDERESVQIYLYYEIEMRERLNLFTAIEQMKYPVLGKRKRLDEDRLVEDVNMRYVEELIGIPAFERLAKSDPDYSRLLQQSRQRLTEQMDALFERGDSMANEAFRTENDRLQKLFNDLTVTITRDWLSGKINQRGG